MAKTSPPRISLFRKYPIVTAIALLATICFAATGAFLATFDLNTYRESLANGLSSTLAKPVSIGSASMSWRHGPAFDLAALRIGDSTTEAMGEIDHLYLQPRLLPLLWGKVVFNDMILECPRYRFSLQPSGSPADTKRLTDFITALPQTVQVHNLSIIDGQLDLDHQLATGPSEQIQVRNIELKINNLLTGRAGKLQFSAKLLQNQQVSTVRIDGRVALDSDISNWQQAKGTLALQLDNIAAKQVFAWIPQLPGSPELHGKAALSLSADGSAADGLHFSARLTGQNLSLVWPSRYQHPPTIKTFAISGIWTSTKNLGNLSELNMQLDNLRLHGHLSLQRNQDQPWLEGTLNSPPIALSDIRRLVPDRMRLSAIKLLHSSTEQGTIQIHHLRFAGPLQNLWQTDTPLPINDARITLKGAHLPLPTTGDLEQVSASLTYQHGDLHLKDGTAVLLQSPVRFFGTAKHLLMEDRYYSFSAEWDAPSSSMWDLLATHQGWKGKASGSVPVTVSLTGSPGQLHGSLQANLAGCVFDWPGIASKPAGQPADLRLSVRQQRNALVVEEGLFRLTPFDLQFSGQIGLTDNLPLDLQLRLPQTDLIEAAQLAPILASHHVKGAVTLNGKMSGPLAKPTFASQLRLNAAGFDIEALEAGISGINGTINIDNQHCRFTNLQALLGQSKIRLDGELTGNADPMLTLQFKTPSVGAGEIIFPGSNVTFRNLSGTLAFGSDRLYYQNIQFDLGAGQGFKLEGSQGLSSPILAELNIHAKDASIDEILALWEEETPVESKKKTNRSRLVIEANVEKGRYGNLPFLNANGTVIAEDETVTISPLNFHTGSGTGQAEIIVDNSDEHQSMLTISGQVTDVDAALLQSELLQQQGLVTGNLSGKVHLQGPAGPDLLTAGTGQADIHIKAGILRKFSFLSKVFSLLNVSQIFTFHLPDMASHGMPFTALDGSFALGQGVLSTEDLSVTSNAMNLSLVGSFDLKQDQLDLLMGVKPFGTVDKIVSKIPLAGWILTGEKKTLITAHFRIKGPTKEPEVEAIPITSVSEKALGIFQRVLGLPGKVISDVGKLFQDKEKPQDQTEQPATSTPDQIRESERTPQ